MVVKAEDPPWCPTQQNPLRVRRRLHASDRPYAKFPQSSYWFQVPKGTTKKPTGKVPCFGRTPYAKLPIWMEGSAEVPCFGRTPYAKLH